MDDILDSDADPRLDGITYGGSIPAENMRRVSFACYAVYLETWELFR